MFQAIEIDGEAYWDGGYSGNPTLTPLVRECKSQDTILVPISLAGRPARAKALGAFWRRVSDAARFSPFQRGPLDVLLGRWTLDSSPIYARGFDPG